MDRIYKIYMMGAIAVAPAAAFARDTFMSEVTQLITGGSAFRLNRASQPEKN